MISGKPAPKIFQKTCNLLHENSDKVLVLEDSINGFLVALKAGCHLIIIPDMVKIPVLLINIAGSKEDSLMNVIDFLRNKFL